MKIKNKISALLVVVFALWLGIVAYIGDYYHAEDTAFSCIENPADGVEVYKIDKNTIFAPEEAKAGFVFYPGGKVQCEAYAPLMEALAEEGVLCVLVEMPANLAVLDINAADGIQEEFSEISKWYIGGHSLGGSMAASYLENSTEQYEGLILLASYSTSDLSETELDVISIYGSNDQVLNKEKYQENKKNLPEDFEEVIIEGGSHAYFGSYGLQEGDGEAEITNEEQIEITAEQIEKMLREKNEREKPEN